MKHVANNDNGRITTSSSRSFFLPRDRLNATPCPTCQGDGHFDSCFDCGNRGYIFNAGRP